MDTPQMISLDDVVLRDDLDQAQYIADFERNRRKTPFGLAQMITLQSHAENGGARHADQLGLTIGALIELRETQTDHDGTYFIIGEAHELARGGKHWATSWYLQPQVGDPALEAGACHVGVDLLFVCCDSLCFPRLMNRFEWLG